MKDNIKKFAEEHNKLLKKYGVTLRFNLVTSKKHIPWIARLATWVLNHYKFTVKTTVASIK